MLNDGQSQVAALSYAPLPKEVVKKLKTTISTIH
jgi:hypothetical protein